jgi:Na+/melibiose symporter-like transporter
MHKLALAGGCLCVLILFTPILDLGNETRADNTAGMAVVGLAAFIFLGWLYWKTRRRLREEENG